jgi:hypothetical protein
MKNFLANLFNFTTKQDKDGEPKPKLLRENEHSESDLKEHSVHPVDFVSATAVHEGGAPLHDNTPDDLPSIPLVPDDPPGIPLVQHDKPHGFWDHFHGFRDHSHDVGDHSHDVGDHFHDFGHFHD